MTYNIDMVLVTPRSKEEFYDGNKVLDVFAQAKVFFERMPDTLKQKLSPRQIERISRILELSETNQMDLLRRSWELGIAIDNFNRSHFGKEDGSFPFPESRIAAIEVSQKFGTKVGEGLKMPNLADNDLPESYDGFFASLTRAIGKGKYKFLEDLEEDESLDRNLLTCMLVDAYAYGVKLMYIEQKGENIDGNLIVNAICELVPGGILREDMRSVGWYDPSYGYDERFLSEMDLPF
jgi:hypothetical protein